MSHEKTEQLISFFAGDIIASIVVFVHLDNHPVILKIIVSAGVGFVGGLFGLIAKDCYSFLKELIKKWKS